MGLSVLVVDDSATVRNIIAKTLALAELPIENLRQAANGREALDLLREAWVDLVFTDINMPEMGGLELLDEMRKDDVLKATPVVVVSTEGSVERIEKIRSLGVPYVRKPFTPEQLKSVIEEVIGAYER